jgi:hypothetical protein
MDEILDYKKDKDAVAYEDRFAIGNNGNIHKRRTTKGWHSCIQWKDGSTSWEPLKDVKESYQYRPQNLQFHVEFITSQRVRF